MGEFTGGSPGTIKLGGRGILVSEKLNNKNHYAASHNFGYLLMYFVKISYRMAFEDVLKNFAKIDICHFVKHDNFAINRKRLMLFPDYGKWRIGERYSESDRAGGCAQFDSVMYNPQVSTMVKLYLTNNLK